MNLIFISDKSNKALIDYMKTRGTVILVPEDARLDNRISSHPDLAISIMDDTLIIDQNANINIMKQLDTLDIPYVLGNSRLAPAYPNDIAYNAVITKNFILHNLDYTNQLLRLHSKYTNKTLIHVNQGYTKCSTVVVNDHSLITADQGIYQAAKDFMNVLLINQGHVSLDGYEYGFLGGTSACLDDSVVFHGDLSKHPDFERIVAFIEAEHKKPVYFTGFPLTDIGSILVYPHQFHNQKVHSVKQKHVNIPIFISHEGCPNDCVFCNQRTITSKVKAMTLPEVAEQIQLYASTLDDKTYAELAFFGGSFTGIDAGLQEEYLKLASEYKKAGIIKAIRLSTRPDYISREILDRLKYYEVDTIELGVQSLNDNVLKASNRGHLSCDVYHAVELIRSYGFRLGIQLMVGLPGDTKERSLLSSQLTALLRPEFVRIYPTLVIRDTELSRLSEQGLYHPLSLKTAIEWTKEMYLVFLRSQIPVIRMGLQPTDLIAEGKEVLSGPFHPAFRQLVESAYFLDVMKRILISQHPIEEQAVIKILCHPKDLSQVIGHNRSNLTELKKVYRQLQVTADSRIKPMTLECLIDPI